MAQAFGSGAPGVQVREIDLTNSVASVGTSAAALVGDFVWGPVDERTQISTDTEMAFIFGKPNDRNYVDWFVGKSFLAYSSNLQVVRVVDSDARNATGDASGLLVKNKQEFNMINDSDHSTKLFVAKYPGVIGNSLKVSIADQGNFANWQYADEFDASPGTSEYATSLGAKYDEVHAVVVDELGEFTGIPGTILERYSFLSKALDAKALDGAPMYYGNVINNQSQYVWFVGNPQASKYYENDGSITDALGDWGSKLIVSGQPTKYKILKANVTPQHDGEVVKLAGGLDGTKPDANELVLGWNQFKSTEEVDIGILITSDGGGELSHTTVVQHVIDNLCENRKDCVATISPKKSDVMNKTQSQAVDSIKKTRNAIGRSSNYSIMDSGWKLTYDVYNDIYRWIPLNGDVAGLMASTERDYDAWWSPAGFNRGRLKNVTSLAFNPNEDSRDALYKVQVNPVVSFLNEGTVLYGDKTMQAKASAFQFINVRRLFITLEKSIGKSAKYLLFEFNDEVSRATFRNMVEPFLREVKGRRGIYDFKVVCDDSNNPPEVIDAAQFVGAIYVKPARSINYIRLDFVAVRTGVEFSEVVGAY